MYFKLDQWDTSYWDAPRVITFFYIHIKKVLESRKQNKNGSFLMYL